MAFTPSMITIYSVGLLGGSLGLALKNSGFTGKIVGLSSDKNIKTALELGCIDEGYPYRELEKVIVNTDLLILCSPINAIIRTIENLSKIKLPEGLIVTDVGSTKHQIMTTAKNLPSHVQFIGGHPMAGSEKSGPDASDPYLFQNAIYVLTPANGNPSEKEHSLADFLEKYLGCRTLFLAPDTHDKIAATVSHVPHLLAVALVCLAQKMEASIPGTLTLAAGGFRDMTRIASAPYDMWHDILVTNKTAVQNILDSYIDTLQQIKESLIDDSLRNCFEQAGAIRAGIPSNSKGFLKKLSEVLVLAKDQPGFIAELSSVLARNKINIKDIEVLKVREGEGGTIRLAFENQDIARKAISLLIQNGFSARERV
ncbi:MAG: prephenate dehydrogenase/arogenate dehydrogenase family protein [Fibrobacter sp.]|jgi:prephenate dehydrogenase|nr:prephenate dehydrogenase/arogenate dehydrogenase family protein [Fibrobacter sp.]